MIPVRMKDGQLVLIEPTLDAEQVAELFAGFELKANREGLFAQPKPEEPAP